MKQEQIEQAVNQYIGYPHETGEGIGVSMRRDAFADGAKWRMESVWHDARHERPSIEADILVCMPHPNGNNEYFVDRYYPIEYALDDEVLDSGYDYNNITRWAYLSDLLPDTEK